MSNSRRNFIKKSAFGLSAIPTFGFISKSNKNSLSNIKNSLSILSINSLQHIEPGKFFWFYLSFYFSFLQLISHPVFLNYYTSPCGLPNNNWSFLDWIEIFRRVVVLRVSSRAKSVVLRPFSTVGANILR